MSSGEGRLSAEEIVRADAAALARAVPHAQVHIVRETAISLGVAQRRDPRIVSVAREVALPIVERSSGGTTVVLGDGDLAWSLVLPSTDPRTGRGANRDFGRLGRAPVRALASLGLDSEWAPAPGVFEDVCLLSGRGQVLRLPGGIAGGAAQHRTGRALLHHGMIHRSVDRDLLARLYPELPRTAAARLVGFGEGPDAPTAEMVRDAVARELEFELEP